MSNPSEALEALSFWMRDHLGDDLWEVGYELINDVRRALEGRPSLEPSADLSEGCSPAVCRAMAKFWAKRAEVLEGHLTESNSSAVQRPAGEDGADTRRLNWLEQYSDHFHNIDRITAVQGKFNGLPTLRAAIDVAAETQRSSSGARSNETSKPTQPEGS